MRGPQRAVRAIVSIVLAAGTATASPHAQMPVFAAGASRAGRARQAPLVPKPMSLIDLASLPRIAGAPPQLSPDGKTLAYLLSRTDWKVGRQIFQIWRQEISGGPPIQLTFSDGGVQPGGPGALRW